MTLAQLANQRVQFALNEITGQLVEISPLPITPKTLIAGDSANPAVLCSMLFDEQAIKENWWPVEPEEVARRFTAENTLIGGCISCTRLI